jgi:DNA polymerase III epsilon subunit-like protein
MASDLIFVDLETTGFNSGYHEVIEIAWVVTDPTGTVVKSRAEYKIRPQFMDRFDQETRDISGYSAAAWSRTVTLRTAMDRFANASKDKSLVAHNAPFDLSFLDAECRRAGVGWAASQQRAVCTKAMAWGWHAAGLWPANSLLALSRYLGVAHPGPHRAANDAENCRQVYLKLLELAQPGLKGGMRRKAVAAEVRKVAREDRDKAKGVQ